MQTVITSRIKCPSCAGWYLQSGMGVELVEEIHEQVYLQRADAKYDVFLRLRSVAAVVPSRLLSLHPQVHQLLELTHGLNRVRAELFHTGALRSRRRPFQRPPTCRGSTTRATQIMMTTSSWEGHMRGVTSPKPTVENVTMQK